MVAKLQLSGKRTLVVGGSRGIGAAIATAYCEAGAKVAVAARSPEALAAVADRIEALGSRPVVIQVDVRSEASVDRAVEEAADRLGGLDVVVDSAGISPIYQRAEQISTNQWDAIFETNARGAFLVARAAGRRFLAQGSGSLIFVTSIYEKVGGERLAAYAASKGAVRQLARSLALDWAARGIRVNCLAPAYVETDLTEGLRRNDRLREELLRQTPTGRWVRLEEVAGAAVYLASDVAAAVTGTTLVIDGGWTAR